MKKMFGRKLVVFGMIALLLLVAGCKKNVVDDIYDSGKTSGIESASETATVYPYTFTDKFGNEVTIDKEPESIISFAPELTESLYALGAGEKLVGRSSYCDYPAEVLSVPDLGTLYEFNVESVIDANPDVVFLSSMAGEDAYKQFVDNGIQVAIFDFDITLAGTKDIIANVGAIVNKNVEAKEINDGIQAAIDEVSAKAKDRETKSVYFAVSVGENTSAATGDTFIGDMITTIGATNAAQDGTFWMYTVEQLVEKNPDYVICSNLWDTKANIESLDGYKDLTAVKEGRLVEVEENIFYRQGPRVVEALYALSDIVYGK